MLRQLCWPQHPDLTVAGTALRRSAAELGVCPRLSTLVGEGIEACIEHLSFTGLFQDGRPNNPNVHRPVEGICHRRDGAIPFPTLQVEGLGRNPASLGLDGQVVIRCHKGRATASLSLSNASGVGRTGWEIAMLAIGRLCLVHGS